MASILRATSRESRAVRVGSGTSFDCLAMYVHGYNPDKRQHTMDTELVYDTHRGQRDTQYTRAWMPIYRYIHAYLLRIVIVWPANCA